MAYCTTCDSSKAMHVSVISVFAFLSLISVIFRFWARMIKSVDFQLNDYLCVGGLIFSLASTLISVHSYVYWGFFSTSVAGNSNIVVIQFKALLVGQLLWITAVTFIRASVIFLYIWIFSKRPFRLACYGILAINLIYFTATVLACCLICRPFAFNWNHSLHGTCGDQKSLDLFIGVFNLLMDVVTVALPLPVLWGLQMPTGRKIALSVLFSMGTAICIITLVRIKITSDITATNSSDQYASIALLTCLEQSLGVINACLPVAKPAFDKLKPDSLISALAGRISSSKRGGTSRDYEMPAAAKPKQITWPMENRIRSKERKKTSEESIIDLRTAVWSPPSSPRKEVEL